MDQDTPTPDSGGDASVLDRLESFLSAGDSQAPEREDDQDATATPEPQADAAATEPKPGDGQAQEPETPEYHLADVAKLLGADESALDVDEDGNILVKTKVDGQEGKAKFADLLKSYQLQGHVDKQVREAAEIRKAAIEERQAIQQQIQVQQAVMADIAEAKAMESVLSKYRQIDWQALIDSDPVQAVKLDRQMRDLETQLDAKAKEIDQKQHYIREQSSNQHMATLQQERQALLQAVPEWSDSAKADAEKKAIHADLKARGYSDRDIQGLSDHKAVLLARDAMLYRQQQAAKQTTEKLVRAAPKIIQPGASGQSNRKATAIQKLRSEVRQTGSRQSVADYLLATGKV